MNEQLSKLVRELENGIYINAVNSSFYRRSMGGLDIKEDKAATDENANIFIKGYASTNAPDFSNEVIPANSWEKHILRYKANPIYHWMHDRHLPIGKVNSFHIDEKGLYLDEVEIIGRILIVKEFLGPLLKAGVLRQQSVGFLALEGHYANGLWYHDENYLIENSLVSVACNPEAEAEIVRSFAFTKSVGVSTLDELVRAYHYNVITEDDRRKHFIMDRSNNFKHKEESPDFTSITITNSEDASLIKNEEPAIKKLPRYHKDYDKYGKLIYAAYNEVSKTYMFSMAVKTENGYKYDFESVAISMCRLLGARGKANYSLESFKGLLERLCNVYQKLEKKIPTADLGDGPIPINEIDEKFLHDIEFRKVTFYEGEDTIFANTVLNQDMQNLAAFMKSLGEKNYDVLTVLKDFIAMVDIWGWIDGPEDAAKLTEILALLTPEPEEVETDEATPGALSGEPYKAEEIEEALIKFREAITRYNKTV